MKKAVILLIILIIMTSCSAKNIGDNNRTDGNQDNGAILAPESELDTPKTPLEEETAVGAAFAEVGLSDDYVNSIISERLQQLGITFENDDEALLYVLHTCAIDEEQFERIIGIDTVAKLEELGVTSIEEAKIKLLQIANDFTAQNAYDQYRLVEYKDSGKGYRAIIEALPGWAREAVHVEIDMLSFPQE
jgi:hypothetical protein